MTLVAGIDSSTQSCKVVVRDADTGEVVRAGRAFHPDGTEVDPAAWWDAMLAAIDDAGGLADVAAVSIAGQQHGMVVLDAEGRVIRPALLWNDTRSARAATDLIAEVGAADYARRTGLVPVASFTATKLRWLRDNEPENAARVEAVALPHDWLTWRLRGFGPADDNVGGPRLEELITDRSDASGTGYWNPNTGRYDRELLELALGHAAMLPRVMKPGVRGGETATFAEHGIRSGSSGSARVTMPPRRSGSVRAPATSSYRSAPAAPSSPSPKPCRPTPPARWPDSQMRAAPSSPSSRP